MSNQINAQINFFGPFLKEKDIPKVLNPQTGDTVHEVQKNILERFFSLPVSALSEEIMKRYVEATTEELHSPIVPHSEEILDRLLNPLRSAKVNYCLGDYLVVIASCGVVGEMLAILVWKMNDIKLKSSSISEEQERGLFGRSFERMGQEQRLKILKTFDAITSEQCDVFTAIKDSRRPYLHLWSAKKQDEKNEALTIFKKTFGLFKEITGIGLADAGMIKVNPLLMSFLNRSLTSRPEDAKKGS